MSGVAPFRQDRRGLCEDATTLRAISGLLRRESGRIEFAGERIDGAPPSRIVARGIAHVPEGRQLFPTMTVLENLELGGSARRDEDGRDPRVGLPALPAVAGTPGPARGNAGTLAEISRNGTTILLIEQNVLRALRLCQRGYVMENGAIVLSGGREALQQNPHVKQAYPGL